MQIKLNGISEVNLRVRSLAESTAFYRDFLGLILQPTHAPSSKACVCQTGDKQGFAVVLREGLTPGTALNIDYFSLEVPSVNDVFEIYQAAERGGVQATRPRIYEGRWQLFLFDPDGYKIEVMTHDDSPPPESRKSS